MGSAARVAGGIVGYGGAAAAVWELFTDQPSSELLRLLAGVMSPESILAGAALSFTLFGIWGTLPVFKWVSGIPERRREKGRQREQKRAEAEAETERQERARRDTENQRAVDGLTHLRDLLRERQRVRSLASPSELAEMSAEIRLLQRDCIKLGMEPRYVPKSLPGAADAAWLTHISALIPAVKRYGIRHFVDDAKQSPDDPGLSLRKSSQNQDDNDDRSNDGPSKPPHSGHDAHADSNGAERYSDRDRERHKEERD
ncbi:MAG: hypothetical protein F4186_11235 [Boseongicola sp. SB0676_bin_33]|nr:hypothetical protein [Boseongicola sp. SB0676_bin_33]MYI06280.1 hypothetical protein [Gemmatimonadota bacterium]